MVNVLKYCQDKKLMHSDLKPENIIITPTNQIKLIDFGAARVFDGGSNVASTYAGTQTYMNPEILQGKKYSFASDLWSMGVIVYEMMTLKFLFEASTFQELQKKIIDKDISTFSSIYSADLIDVVKSLLSKDPFSRISIKNL